LHCVVDGSEGVRVFHEVFSEAGGFVGCSECILVFLEPCGKAPAGLSHTHLVTVGACQLVYSWSWVYVWSLLLTH